LFIIGDIGLRGAKRAIAPLGCEGAACAVASSMLPHASTRQDPTPILSATTAGGIQLLKPASAPLRRHYQRPKPVKGKSPQGPRATVHIKQYSSPAATASRPNSSKLPRASLLCHRRKPAVETCVDNTAKLRPQASVLAQRPSTCKKLRLQPSVLALRPFTCNAQRAAPRARKQPGKVA
jgi:hypothetical protein